MKMSPEMPLAKHMFTEKGETRHVLQSAQGCFDRKAERQQRCNCSLKLLWHYSSMKSREHCMWQKDENTSGLSICYPKIQSI
jgi:hypothetical protein